MGVGFLIVPPGYDVKTGTNTGNLNFQTPVGQNQYYDPNIQLQVPFQGGFLDILKGYDPTNNPTAYRYDPRALTPTKMVYDPYNPSVPNSPATQTVNGQTVNIGANNYLAGTSSPQQYQFQASTPSVPSSQTTPAPYTGFMFGNNGSLGNIKGTFDQGVFYQNQPSSTTAATPGLGTLTPWNPALSALQQNRTNP